MRESSSRCDDVLFHESARVAVAAIPERTEIVASTCHDSEDGWEVDYSVTETVPPPETPEADSRYEGFLHYSLLPDPDDDDREVTLRFVKDSTVHHVTWVKVSTEPHSVHRYRREKHADRHEF